MPKKTKIETRSGVVAIVGRPNVGKSTLLNSIIGEKVAIVSKVPQTTRNQIKGIYNDERGQIVFIDTPGLHSSRDNLDKFMNQSSLATLEGADCIIYLVDVSRRLGEEEKNIVDKVKGIKAPVILALNKVDLGQDRIPEYLSFWEKAKGKPVTEMKNFSLIVVSAARKDNIEELIDIIFGYLPNGPLLYPEDIVCDVPRKMVMADIIREKFFLELREELPHALGVVIERVQPKKGKTLHIRALIFVEREHQKEIVIGRGGSMLKQVGTAARKDLEEVLETKVFLELYVKVNAKWRDDISLLQESGYGLT
ncbi:MAG: GTPase Era [Candidatus Omnitrophica bacterium]|nr:GTPase Era [Candidatus Omnitrophota bacterium]